MTPFILVLILLALIVIGYFLLTRTNVIAATMNQRLDIEKQTADSVRKLENIFLRSGAKGSAGENIVDFILSTIPPTWIVRNLVVGNKVVEFGIHLPNDLVLPIDSKLIVTDLLDQFTACQDAEQQRKIKNRIHAQTEKRALDVRKYIDPTITTSFGLAIVPDALFTVCSEIIPTLSQQNVLLVSYGMLIPYILLIIHMTPKAALTLDSQRVDAFLKSATQSITDIQDLLQGKYSKAITMMNNFRGEMEAELAKLKKNLALLQSLEINTALEAAKPEATLEAGAS